MVFCYNGHCVVFFLIEPEKTLAPTVSKPKNDFIKNGQASSNVARDFGEIKVAKPSAGEKISSLLEVRGEADSSWFFEGSFPVIVIDEESRELGSTAVSAESDWMKTGMISFSGKISLQKPSTKKGKIIFRNDNPSGLPEKEKKIEFEIEFDNN